MEPKHNQDSAFIMFTYGYQVTDKIISQVEFTVDPRAISLGSKSTAKVKIFGNWQNACIFP